MPTSLDRTREFVWLDSTLRTVVRTSYQPNISGTRIPAVSNSEHLRAIPDLCLAPQNSKEGYKLGMAAQKSWRRLRGFEHLAKIIAGAQFKDGIEVTTPMRRKKAHQPAQVAACSGRHTPNLTIARGKPRCFHRSP